MLSEGVADKGQQICTAQIMLSLTWGNSGAACAGIALVNAHGQAQAAEMLVLFEGTLDRKGVADEGQYDLIRQGAIVSMGTLARHLSHDVEKASPVGSL